MFWLAIASRAYDLVAADESGPQAKTYLVLRPLLGAKRKDTPLLICVVGPQDSNLQLDGMSGNED